MPRKMQLLDTTRRDASGDLLFAFIFAGWETLMPIQEAVEMADYLAWTNPINARKLSGLLIRGEVMTPEITAWISTVRNVNGQLATEE